MGSHVNENENLKLKILKKKKKKKCLEIWWIGSFPQNLSWIHAVVSEKPEFMDDGRTTDACATTVALLTKSSRAKTEYPYTETASQWDPGVTFWTLLAQRGAAMSHLGTDAV